MKKFIIFLVFLLGIFTLYNSYTPFQESLNALIYYSPCDTPLRYKTGSIDSRFQIDETALIADLRQAAGIWNSTYGKPLFVYDPEGEITVNLIYDKRQSLNMQINQLENQIVTNENTIKPQIAQYQTQVKAFKERLAKLNEQISYWNTQGGAPPDEFEKLTKERDELQKQADKLNTMAQSLNQSTQEYNTQVRQLNSTVDSFNTLLQYRPEEGLYNSEDSTISIYITNNQTELIHTLAHELGHARGLEHVKNPNAIMFPYTTQSVLVAPDDAQLLTEFCKKRSVAEIAVTKIKLLVIKIRGAQKQE